MTPAGPTLSKEFILDGKRTRVMEAAARSVCERGIHESKISVLVRAAGVARKTFYECFTGKDDCLQQTLCWVGELAHQRIVDAQSARAIGDSARTRHGLAALLDFVAEQPDLARFYLVYGPAVSLSIFEEAQGYFGELLEPLGIEQPFRALLTGSIAETLRRQLVKDPAADPRLQLKALTDFVMAAPRGKR